MFLQLSGSHGFSGFNSVFLQKVSDVVKNKTKAKYIYDKY